MSAPALDDFAEHFADLVHAFKHHLRRAIPEAKDGGEITVLQAKTLQFVVRGPGRTQQDLVTHSGRDKAQVARLIKDLEEKGLIVRTPDPADRRVQRLTPTPAGQEAAARLACIKRVVTARMLDGLSDADLADLSRLIAAMRENLRWE